MDKIRILQINATYNFRSTGRITSDIHDYLLSDNRFEPFVIYGRGPKTNDQGVYKIVSEFYGKTMNFISKLSGVIFGNCFVGTHRAIKLIKKINPDIVHVQCPNGYFVNIPRLISFLNKNGIVTLFTQHCEFFYTGNCGYSIDCTKWKNEGCNKCYRLKDATGSIFFDRTKYSFNKMKKAFENFEKHSFIVSCTPWLNSQASQSIILHNFGFGVVYNGANTNIFHFKQNESIRKKHNIPSDKKIIVYVNPVFTDPTKGGHFLFEFSKRLLPHDIVILLIGNDDKTMSFEKNVINVGKINDSSLLSEYYSCANLSLILSKRECFPMTIVEALCCGTKVIGFKCFGPDAAFEKEDVELVDFGDIDSLIATMFKNLNERPADKIKRSKKINGIYSVFKMADNYSKIYIDLYEKYCKKN